MIHHIGHPFGRPDFRALAMDSSLQTASISLQVHVGEKSEDCSVGRCNIKYREVNILKGETSTQWNDSGHGFWANTFLGSLNISQKNSSETQFLRVPPHSIQSSSKLISGSFINNSSFPNSLSILPFSVSEITSQINFLHSCPCVRRYLAGKPN